MKKKFRHILIISFIVMSIVFIAINFTKERNSFISRKETIAQEVVNNINLKLELLLMSITNLKTNELVQAFNYNPDDYYNISQVLEVIKNKNNLNSKLGYKISLGNIKTDLIIANNGTYHNKKTQEFILDKFTKKRSIRSKYYNNNIYIYIKDSFYNPTNNLYWIIEIDRNLFFKEALKSNYDKWTITVENNEILLNTPIDNEGLLSKLSKKVTFETLLDLKTSFYISYQFLIAIFLKEVFTTLFFLGILFLGIDYLINSLYNQIKEIAKKLSFTSNNSENEEGNEISFINKTLDSIYNEKDSLIDKINTLSISDRRKNLRDFILGIREFKDYSNMTKKFLKILNPNLKIVLLEIYDGDSKEDVENFKIVRDYIKESFADTDNCEYINIDYKSILLIFEDEKREVLDEGFEYFLQNLKSGKNLNLVAAISEEIETIDNLPKRYIECKKILESRYLFSNQRVLFKDKIQTDKVGFIYSIETEAKLSSKLLNNNPVGAKRIIEEIFEEIDSLNSNVKIKELAALFHKTFSRILIQLKEIEQNHEISQIDIDFILTEKTTTSLKEDLLNLISEVSKYRKEIENIDEEIIKEKIVNYINENYKIDFSLENLADHLGFSFKYTSVLFKKIMGDNFKNYINLYRIDVAKKIMLSDEKVKIKDLAEIIGFNSSNTFIRVFKRYEGVSPNQWYLENKR